MYGAFDGDKLVGVAATKSEGGHISLFFVDKNYHRQGLGRQLFETILNNCISETITVNSSPYAVEIYKKLKFTVISEEKTRNGIRFIPMLYRK